MKFLIALLMILLSVMAFSYVMKDNQLKDAKRFGAYWLKHDSALSEDYNSLKILYDSILKVNEHCIQLIEVPFDSIHWGGPSRLDSMITVDSTTLKVQM